MDLPKRKTHRLKKFDYGNGYFFVTVCTNNKEKLLCDIVGNDALVVPSDLGKRIIECWNNIEKLNDFRIKVGKELDNIDDYMKLVKDNVKYIETTQDIKDLKESIDNISYSIKNSKYEKIINPIKDVLENAIIDFNEIRIGFNDRSFLEGRFIEIQNKYSKTILDKVMENQRKDIEKNLSKLENNYINTIKKDIISKVNELNYRQCIEYINKLSNIPIYISTKGIKEIDLMLDLLQDRLNDNKIDTIMSMFTELDKNSQKKCINMLEDIFN